MQDLGNDEIFKGCFLISGGATLATTEILCPFNDNDSGCDHKGEDEDAVGGSRGVATQLAFSAIPCSQRQPLNPFHVYSYQCSLVTYSHISKFV